MIGVGSHQRRWRIDGGKNSIIKLKAAFKPVSYANRFQVYKRCEEAGLRAELQNGRELKIS